MLPRMLTVYVIYTFGISSFRPWNGTASFTSELIVNQTTTRWCYALLNTVRRVKKTEKHICAYLSLAINGISGELISHVTTTDPIPIQRATRRQLLVREYNLFGYEPVYHLLPSQLTPKGGVSHLCSEILRRQSVGFQNTARGRDRSDPSLPSCLAPGCGLSLRWLGLTFVSRRSTSSYSVRLERAAC